MMQNRLFSIIYPVISFTISSTLTQERSYNPNPYIGALQTTTISSSELNGRVCRFLVRLLHCRTVRATRTGTNCLVKNRLFKTLTGLRKGQNVNHKTTFGFVDGPYDLFKKEVQSINIWYRYFAVFSLKPFFNKSF